MAKATIEVEIPDGWEFDRYDAPKPGEYVFFQDEVLHASELKYIHIIVRKVEPVTELAVRFKPGWIAMDENGDWCWYEEKPILERNVWGSLGRTACLEFLQMPAVTDWKQSLMRVG